MLLVMCSFWCQSFRNYVTLHKLECYIYIYISCIGHNLHNGVVAISSSIWHMLTWLASINMMTYISACECSINCTSTMYSEWMWVKHNTKLITYIKVYMLVANDNILLMLSPCVSEHLDYTCYVSWMHSYTHTRRF